MRSEWCAGGTESVVFCLAPIRRFGLGGIGVKVRLLRLLGMLPLRGGYGLGRYHSGEGVMLQQLHQCSDDSNARHQHTAEADGEAVFKIFEIVLGGNAVTQRTIKCVSVCSRLFLAEPASFQTVHKGQLIKYKIAHAANLSAAPGFGKRDENSFTSAAHLGILSMQPQKNGCRDCKPVCLSALKIAPCVRFFYVRA